MAEGAAGGGGHSRVNPYNPVNHLPDPSFAAELAELRLGEERRAAARAKAQADRAAAYEREQAPPAGTGGTDGASSGAAGALASDDRAAVARAAARTGGAGKATTSQLQQHGLPFEHRPASGVRRIPQGRALQDSIGDSLFRGSQYG